MLAECFEVTHAFRVLMIFFGLNLNTQTERFRISHGKNRCPGKHILASFKWPQTRSSCGVLQSKSKTVSKKVLSLSK
jgi:hypothetical protein